LRYAGAVKRALWLLVILGCQTEKTATPPPPAVSAISVQECKLFLVKARATLQELGSRVNVSYTDQIETRAIKDCEDDVAGGKPMRLGRCVLDATTEDAVHKCFPTYDQLKDRKTP
jgi:hypothetical protein